MTEVVVVDARGRPLSPTDERKALRLVRDGKAVVLKRDPLTIRLDYEVQVRASRQAKPRPLPGEGKRILVHTCCAPCATYTVECLRELAFDVTGYWHNPNVHPFAEHELRRETLAGFARAIDLPVVWEPGYEIVDYFRAVIGQERFRVRCKACYELRLERTAQAAARRGYDAFTTTLLISPYQDQAAIRIIGEQAASRHSVEFFFENFRRGWAESFQATRQHDLYSQHYCGCVYSEWEARDRNASTYPRGNGAASPK